MGPGGTVTMPGLSSIPVPAHQFTPLKESQCMLQSVCLLFFPHSMYKVGFQQTCMQGVLDF